MKKERREEQMNRRLMTGNEAAAWGARLSRADYVPSFPITPQTEIIETIARWTAAGEMEARLVMMESEHSMVTAAGAAAATGVRVFMATSSQGLLYATEMLFSIPGWRVPLVLVNVSRGLSSPITLEPDHNDVLAMRDSGFLQIHAASCQEVLDAVLLACRLGEDPRVRLPVLVNMDGFYLSFTREAVEVPPPALAAAFVGEFHPTQPGGAAGSPSAQGVAVMGGATYSYFRYQVQLAHQSALRVYDDVSREFQQTFGRPMEAVEAYRMEGAQVAFLMIGSFSSKARGAVDALREAGEPVGMIRPRLLRPYPARRLRELARGVRALVVVDQNLSPGLGGILHGELAGALYNGGTDLPGAGRNPVLLSYIGGLGGRNITTEEFFAMAAEAREALETGVVPPPRLLYTGAELEQVRRQQNMALVKTAEAS
ncbi:MAG: pyruvate synthase [Deltaproteobacteria bacterium]|nr:pyruvate synthase [Deltaproteobacteria bacterium]